MLAQCPIIIHMMGECKVEITRYSPVSSRRWITVDSCKLCLNADVLYVSIPLWALDLCRRLDTHLTITCMTCFHTPQGVGPLSMIVRVSFYDDTVKFPYPSGRWTAVDISMITRVKSYVRFHTPQGVGPLSTEDRAF